MPLSCKLPRIASPSHRRWMLRDKIAAAALFLATAAVVLWQNAHVATIWDISYTLDSSWRIALGQMPYRDFPFVHAPLPFLIQAAIIRLTGRVFFHHVIYAAFVGGLGTVLTWRIALHTLQGRVQAAWTIALLLATPLSVLGLYCILPHPSYDCDCAFSILVAVWMLQRLAPNVNVNAKNLTDDDTCVQQAPGWTSGLAAGFSICLPLFFKQNMGLPFLLAALGAVALILAVQLPQRSLSRLSFSSGSAPAQHALLAVLLGAAAALAIAVPLIQFTAGLGNYLHWTIVFAGQRRLPPWGLMLEIYRDPTLLWTLPCIAVGLLLLVVRLGKPRLRSAVALALLAAPFIFALSSLLMYDDADERGDSLVALWPLLLILTAALVLWNFVLWNLVSLRSHLTLQSLLPLILLAAIHGTFLSQQLWGSTYAIWPLLSLLLAELIAFLAGLTVRHHNPNPDAKPSSQWVPTALTALIAATLLVCGAFYTASEERLLYADLDDGPVLHSAFPALAGLSTSGPYLPEFDELLRYAAAEIPFNDGLILLPGEDPFYFATGRVPQFPVLLFDPATDPYSPAQTADLARSRNIRWLIVKRHLQIKGNPMPQPEATLAAFKAQFALHAQLRGYDIYRRP
jgi:CDP-diglyceride synthetase